MISALKLMFVMKTYDFCDKHLNDFSTIWKIEPQGKVKFWLSRKKKQNRQKVTIFND